MNTLSQIFDWLLIASFRASVVTLAVLLIQWGFKRQFSARARYALWLPVLFVLLTPVLPKSRWSLENFFMQSALPVYTPLVTQSPVLDVSMPEKVGNTSLPKSVDWLTIGLGVWLSISLGLLFFSGISFLRALRRFQNTRIQLSDEWTAEIAHLAHEIGLIRAPRVWCSTAITSPAVTGFWRPVLLLPALFERDFTASEVRLIIQHELTHLKRHDLPLNALLCLLMALHWFNPLLWLAFFKVRLDREAACDAQVLENAQPQRRVEYGHALLKAETSFSPLHLSLGFVGLFQRGAALRSRIQSIASHHQPHPAMKLTTIASIGLLTFLGITSAEEPSNLIGKTDFRPGDSIHMTDVQRGDGFLTVTADYELASEPEAKISLFITVTKGDGKSDIAASQYKKISKGKGTVTLHHPAVSEGMPHVSFYPSGGGSSFGGIYFGTQAEADASQKITTKEQPPINPIEAKLKTIVLPSVIFSKATVEEAVDFLRIKGRALDTSSTEPKGVNILLQSRDMASASITLDLRDVTLGEALRYVADLAGLEMRVNSSAVLLAPKGSPAQPSPEAEAASPIILPQVEFREATLDEAITFIRIKSRDIDPAKKGVNILLKPGGAGAKITLSLQKVPVNEALRYIAELAGHRLSVDGTTYILDPMK